jgi:hypothetical protein
MAWLRTVVGIVAAHDHTHGGGIVHDALALLPRYIAGAAEEYIKSLDWL